MSVNKKLYEDRELKAALELDAVPQIVDQKLRALYAELPDRVPTGEKQGVRKGVRRVLTAASAVAAAFVILLCGAAINPAFAESLPIIGSLFGHMQNHSGWKNSEKTLLSLSKYAQPLEDVTAQAAAKDMFEKPMTLSAEEVYYDGNFLYVGLSAELDVNEEQLFFHTLSGGYNLLIDGEALGRYEEGKGMVYEDGSFELDRCVLEKSGDGHYIGKRGQLLPERFRNQESLSVTLQFQGVYYMRELTGLQKTLNFSPVELSFTAKKNDAPTLAFDGNGAEMGGVRLQQGVATPAGICIDLDLPEQYNNPACGISFEGGGATGPVGHSDPEPSLENGYVRKTLVCGGYGEDEQRRLLVSVFDKNDTDEYVAVFLVDPRTGEIELGSADDIVHFESSVYYCPPEELQNSEAQNKIALASHKNGGNEFLLFIATKDESPKQDTRIEIWQGDTLLGFRENEEQRNDHFYDHTFTYDDETGDRTHYEAERNTYIFGVLGMETLDRSRPVTVKLYDGHGSLLMDESVQIP